MPINLDVETVLGLTEAARTLPKVGGRRPHPGTLWRWCRLGVRSRNGDRVRLEHARIGHRIVTSREALNRFANRLAELDHQNDAPSPPAPAYRSDKRRAEDIRRAEAELAEAGA